MRGSPSLAQEMGIRVCLLPADAAVAEVAPAGMKAGNALVELHQLDETSQQTQAWLQVSV